MCPSCWAFAPFLWRCCPYIVFLCTWKAFIVYNAIILAGAIQPKNGCGKPVLPFLNRNKVERQPSCLLLLAKPLERWKAKHQTCQENVLLNLLLLFHLPLQQFLQELWNHFQMFVEIKIPFCITMHVSIYQPTTLPGYDPMRVRNKPNGIQWDLGKWA